MIVRASETDRVMACPPSLLRPEGEVRIDLADETATFGTAVHEYCAAVRRGEQPDGAQLAAEHGVDADELERVSGYDAQAWAEFGHNFAGPFEVELGFEYVIGMDLGGKRIVLSGHPDLAVSLAGDPTGRGVWERKSGFKSESGPYVGQLKSYCYDQVMRHNATRAVAVLVFLRDRSAFPYHWTLASLKAWAIELVEAVRSRETARYRPGVCCTFCPRRLSCPAHTAEVRGALALVEPLITGTLLVPADILRAYRGVQHAEKLAKRAREVLHGWLEAGATIQVGDDALVLREGSKRVLDPQLARPVIEGNWLTKDELAAVVKMPIGALEDAVLAKMPKDAPHGAKAARKRELSAALDAAGAIRMEQTRNLALVKVEDWWAGRRQGWRAANARPLFTAANNKG